MHKHDKDIVRLQNVQKPDHWIAIKNDETTGIVSDSITCLMLISPYSFRLAVESSLIFVYTILVSV